MAAVTLSASTTLREGFIVTPEQKQALKAARRAASKVSLANHLWKGGVTKADTTPVRPSKRRWALLIAAFPAAFLAIPAYGFTRTPPIAALIWAVIGAVYWHAYVLWRGHYRTSEEIDRLGERPRS